MAAWPDERASARGHTHGTASDRPTSGAGVRGGPMAWAVSDGRPGAIGW